MDRRFMLQPAFSKRIPDGPVILESLRRRCPMSLDSREESDDAPRGSIPVGDLVFCQRAMDGASMPIEVPACLSRFLGGEYHVMSGSDIPYDMLEKGWEWFSSHPLLAAVSSTKSLYASYDSNSTCLDVPTSMHRSADATSS